MAERERGAAMRAVNVALDLVDWWSLWGGDWVSVDEWLLRYRDGRSSSALRAWDRTKARFRAAAPIGAVETDRTLGEGRAAYYRVTAAGREWANAVLDGVVYVSCPRCRALPGEACARPSKRRSDYHAERWGRSIEAASEVHA